LSSKGHGECVKFVKSFQLPLLVLGGGGYTVRNVSRVWTYETAVLLNEDIPDDLPYNDYIEYYGPDFRLHIPSTNMENANSREYLEKFKNKILENIRQIGRPNAGTSEIPPDAYLSEEDEEFDDPDNRRNLRQLDKRITRDNEISDSEEEEVPEVIIAGAEKPKFFNLFLFTLIFFPITLLRSLFAFFLLSRLGQKFAWI